MTRAERLAQQVRKAKEKLVQQQEIVAKREAAQREAVRKDVNKRRYLVGALAHEAGLFAWSNTDLADIFTALASLGDVPNPVTVLQGLLDVGTDAEGGGINGDLAEITLTRFVPPFGPMGEASGIPSPLVSEGRPGGEDADNPRAAAGVFVKEDDLRHAEFQGVVYVIQMEGHPWVKIGYTTGGASGLRRRIAYLQAGCPLPLRILKAYTCELPDKLEIHVHRALAASRRKGEWFETDLEAIDEAIKMLWTPEWDREKLRMNGEHHGRVGPRTNGV